MPSMGTLLFLSGGRSLPVVLSFSPDLACVLPGQPISRRQALALSFWEQWDFSGQPAMETFGQATEAGFLVDPFLNTK